MRISDWSSDVCSSDLHRLIGDDAADGVGIGITGAVAVPDEELLLLVFGRGIGLGDVKGDGAFAQGFNDRLGQRGETQATFDEPAGQAKALRQAVDLVVEADRKSTRLNSSP